MLKKQRNKQQLIQFIIGCIFIVGCNFVRRQNFSNVKCLSFFSNTLSFYMPCVSFGLIPNLYHCTILIRNLQIYDLLNSTSEIPNIRIASIAFKLFCNKRFLISFFAMFMWLKKPFQTCI